MAYFFQYVPREGQGTEPLSVDPFFIVLDRDPHGAEISSHLPRTMIDPTADPRPCGLCGQDMPQEIVPDGDRIHSFRYCINPACRDNWRADGLFTGC